MKNREPLQITEAGQVVLGSRLKEFRRRNRLSLRGASDYIMERTGGATVSFTTLGDIERGIRKTDVDTLLLFAQSGYGGMCFEEMVNLLTGKRLALCEKGESYRVGKKEEAVVA